MRRRRFIMILFVFSAVKPHRALQPLLEGASHRKASLVTSRGAASFVAATTNHHATSAAITCGSLPAFHGRRCSSALPEAAASRPATLLHLSSVGLITDSRPGLTISPEEDYVLNFKGKGSAKTGGAAASGIVLYDNQGSEVWSGMQDLGDATQNEAEYVTFVTGLQCALKLGVRHIEARSNNQLLIRQMEGTNKVKSRVLMRHYQKAMSLSKEFLSFQISYVDRSQIGRAVDLANMAIANLDDAKENDAVPESEIDTLLAYDSTAPTSKIDSDEGIANQSGLVPPAMSPGADKVSKSDPGLGSISPEKTYVLRFDGGSRGNPGTAGCGMALYDTEDGAEVWSGCQYLGERSTNNEAEYMGLITGMQCARSLGVEHIVVQGDSQLILRQVEGRYQVKSPNLKEYYNEAMSLSREFASFQTSHIERARNARADGLANEAMDTRSSRGFEVSQ